MNHLRHLLLFGWRTSPRLALGALLLSTAYFVQAIIPLLVTAFVVAGTTHDTGIGALLGIALFLSVGGNWLLVLVGARCEEQLRSQISRAVDRRIAVALTAPQTIEHFSDPNVATLRRRLADGGDRIGDAWKTSIQLINSFIYPLVMTTSAMILDRRAILLAIGCLPAIVISGLQARIQENGRRTAHEDGTHSADLLHTLASGDSARHARSMGFSERLLSDFDVHGHRWLKTRTRADVHRALLGLAGQLFYTACAIGLLVSVVSGTSSHRAATISGLSVAILFLYGTVAGIQEAYVEASGVSARFDDLTQLEMRCAEFSHEDHTPVIGSPGEIRLDHISFAYPDGSLALDDISLSIPLGTRVVLLGGNGAGKSTLLMLLSGLIRPTTGTIEIGTSTAVSSIDRAVTGASQGGLHLRYQLRTEVAAGAGKDTDRIDDDVVVSALHRTEATALLAEPGLSRDLLSTDLSGGEWQKVASARASIDQTAWIKLLDEPAASLDPYQENALLEREMDIDEHQTRIMVSHSLAVAAHADLIVHLRKGKILAAGSHRHLLSVDDEYRATYEQQTRAYE